MILNVGVSGRICDWKVWYIPINLEGLGLITTILFSELSKSLHISLKQSKKEITFNQRSNVKQETIPWREILTSTPYWSFICIICCQEFGAFIVLSRDSYLFGHHNELRHREQCYFLISASLFGMAFCICVLDSWLLHIRKYNFLSLAG